MSWLFGKIYSIDEYKWPLRGPSVWLYSDINSLYPEVILNLTPPSQDYT